MMITQKRSVFRGSYLTKLILLIASGTVVNFALSVAVRFLGLPLYLDSIGTIAVAMLGGTFPAVIVGFLSNALISIFGVNNLYFCVINVLIGVSAAWCARRGIFSKVWKVILAVLCFAVFSGTLSAVISWFINGAEAVGVASDLTVWLGDRFGVSPFWASYEARLVVELADKTVCVACSIGIFHLVPKAKREHTLEVLGANDIDGQKGTVHRSLVRKVIAVVLAAEVLLGALACGICFFLYRSTAIRRYTDTCEGVVNSAVFLVDPDRVEEFISIGRTSWAYEQAEEQLYGLRDSFPEIEYIYAYQILPDGCHVVFDLDTDELEGAPIGTVVEFDESFDEYLPALLAGEDIDPIVTDDTYGWLLTVYKPIRNRDGKCVCYMCADIRMDDIITDEAIFTVKMISLFFGVSILIVCAILELVKRGMIRPLNSMAGAASRFAYDTDEGRVSGVDGLKELDIHSGDEVENLYNALVKMAGDSARYIDEVKQQNEQITRMQEEIILDFAEMVEARDKCTGDHIKKTSKYVKAIAEELRREGRFPEIMTDEYVDSLVRSAPLHDVGKIKISDLILNKPGRLTDEEFELMKTHTTEGRNILSGSSSLARSSGYLNEAIDMANYHHERWDGRGYPTGLKGDEIPLSARIMAVADVFDALVSRRSYKEPFTFEKATDIIREESGTHFDPTVVDAFLAIANDVYEEE